MNKEKLIEIINKIEKKSNKDLNSGLNFLKDEFEKSKELIIDLTRHIDTVEENYNKILNELNRRKPV